MDVLEYIDAVKSESPGIEYRCLHGDCYRFASHLKDMFGGVLMMNEQRDHVGVKIGSNIYDISGKLGRKTAIHFHVMSATEKRVASKWGYRARS